VAPTFVLEDPEGTTVSSDRLLAKGPLVVTFYRGVWCPYCNMDLQALEEARPEIEARGATLVALSMQNAVNSRRSTRQNNLGFPILSDPHGKVADAFGLRFALPDYLVDIYKNVFKNDLAIFNEDDSWTLPMPARYVIGQDGVIAYSEVNPDYTHRPDPSELLPTLDRLARSRAA
jgi:peroxiredoxin